jgi:hypothetical protein
MKFIIWLKSLIVAMIVTIFSLSYAHFIKQLENARSDEWVWFGVMVFIPSLFFSFLFQKIQKLPNIGFSRLFLVFGFISAIVGVFIHDPTDIPSAASVFTFYGVLGFGFCLIIWWIILGFSEKNEKH